MKSGNKINYALRPAKSIERRLLIEVLKEICTPSKCEQYCYLGFGSHFFEDFKLIHKYLGISEMYSMEKSTAINTKKRCYFNLPYKCIKLVFQLSTHFLAKFKTPKK